MKALLFACLAALALARVAPAQTPASNTAPEATIDPAKLADYQKRFKVGCSLEQAGQLTEARSIFEGILAEQPNAKGSLYEAGRTSWELNEPLKADAYLERLHTLVPDFPGAVALLIQADQALRRDAKVDQLVRDLRALHDASTDPKFHNSLFFERDRIRMDAGSEIIIWQFFDYTKPPNIALKAQLFDARHQPSRELLLRYDPSGTQSVRAKDPKLAKDEVFMVAEPTYVGTRMTKIDVYQELLATPNYAEARSMLLDIFETSPKPIFSRPVTGSGP